MSHICGFLAKSTKQPCQLFVVPGKSRCSKHLQATDGGQIDPSRVNGLRDTTTRIADQYAAYDDNNKDNIRALKTAVTVAHLDTLRLPEGPPERTVVMTVGMPGCGKSTWINKAGVGEQTVSSDAIRVELMGNADDQSRNSEVSQIMHERLGENAAGDRKYVVADSTGLTPRQREGYMTVARQAGATRFVAVRFEVPEETARARNLARERVVPEGAMDRMAEQFRETTGDVLEGEGWEVVTSDDWPR